jgi:predicted transcriptional regulator of viral defense system
MAKPTSKEEQVLALARKQGVIRPRDLNSRGIPREYLRRLHAKGKLERPGRGLYIAADSRPTQNHSFAEAAKRVPKGVVCLLSALRFHGVTTEAPFEVWLAISAKARLPRVDHPPIRFVRFSGAALESNIEEHTIEGIKVRVYDAAKTVADCFKYRNKIGVDVAIEALRDCRKRRKASMDELWNAARVCRVGNVMRPYLEAVA